jgi:hypothetical protein
MLFPSASGNARAATADAILPSVMQRCLKEPVKKSCSSVLVDPVDTDSAEPSRFGVATKALKQTGLRELACIRVRVSELELTLDGEVATFYLKQLATESVRPHATGLAIRNRLQVPARDR